MPTILVVDDEEAVRSTFRDVLHIEGHHIVTASSFEEARVRLQERRFDVALTDLMLPQESGLSLLRFALQHDPELSVVLVTGHPDLSTAVAALKQGAYDYIAKPVTRQALVATVQRASERTALVRERQRLQAENEDYQRSLERKVHERTSRLRESERRYRDLFRETRRAYEELQRTQEKLIRSERLAAIGELAAQIAHEIRNPLGAISNSVGVLRRDLMLEGDDKRLLEVVRQESERLEGIIADFLKFARPRPIHKTQQKITEVVDDLLLLLSQERGATGPSRIEIKKEYQDGLPGVELDQAQTREALWNLLVNAVEAMPQGGTLSVAVLHAEDGDAIDVVVSDTGKGISEDEQKKIFQPFHTTKADGTGLGLAIVQRVVEAHSGELRLESELGAGSAFFLRFPSSSTNDERESIEVSR